jgi:hypothetical protein
MENHLSVKIGFKNIKTGDKGVSSVLTETNDLKTPTDVMHWIFDIRDCIAESMDWKKIETLVWVIH